MQNSIGAASGVLRPAATAGRALPPPATLLLPVPPLLTLLRHRLIDPTPNETDAAFIFCHCFIYLMTLKPNKVLC